MPDMYNTDKFCSVLLLISISTNSELGALSYFCFLHTPLKFTQNVTEIMFLIL